ncbi:MAG: CHAT domain-containing protein [Pyrinomonadaceae bacterium]|nr:CHAT domain-containing protein [Pyrinomonadaceae bacterium]
MSASTSYNFPSHSIRNIFVRSFFLLTLVFLTTVTLHAQSDTDSKRDLAEKLRQEASQLYTQQTETALREALSKYEAALSIYRTLDDRFKAAATLNDIGLIHVALNNKETAFVYFAQALQIYRAADNKEGESLSIQHLFNLYSSLDNREKLRVMEMLTQMRKLINVVGNRALEIYLTIGIGYIHFELGDYQKALDFYNQALPLIETQGNATERAYALNLIAIIYGSIGERQKELDFYNQAIPLFRLTGNRIGEGFALGHIGEIYSDLGELAKALEYYEQALPLLRDLKDGEPNTLISIGDIYFSKAEYAKAFDHYQRALLLGRAAKFQHVESAALISIGFTHLDLNEPQKALESFTQALALKKSIGSPEGQAFSLYGMAVAHRDSGDLNEALTNIEAALSIIEGARAKIASQELRSTYFARTQHWYEFYVDLLMHLHTQHPTAGYNAAALQANERSRARSLLEMLVEARADIRQGVEPRLLEQERSLQQRLNGRARQQAALLNETHTEEQSRAVAKEIGTLTTQLQQVEAQIRQSSPRYAALTQPQPLSLREIQPEVLDKDTILLEYSLGAARSYLWVVTQDSIQSYVLPKRAQIEDAARQVYKFLSKPNRDKQSLEGKPGVLDQEQSDQMAPTDSSAARLSQMILAPVAAQLGKQRLLIVADGALQFIPFAALPSPAAKNSTAAYRPLILDHEIVTLPSASTLAVLRREVKGRRPAPKTFAVLADPVFDRADERLKNIAGKAAPSSPGTDANAQAQPDASKKASALRDFDRTVIQSAQDSDVERAGLAIPRLPGTRREAEQILKLVPATERKQAFGFSADRKAATDPALGQYRYIHFATHGLLDSQHPELSGILFSMFDDKGEPQDGFLRAHEIFNLKLPAELVVLSACQTGLGKEVKGEGLVGLTRGFMYAGAPRVVVSLWNVSDQGTAELMTRFYQAMLKQGMRPAQALQAAQKAMVRDGRFTSPYYWAAFTLQGEWR